MTDDLSVLEPAGSSVTYQGRTIDVRPIKVGQVPAIVRAARPVIDAVLALESLPDADDAVLALESLPDADDAALVDVLLDLLGTHGDAVFVAAALFTGESEDALRDGDIDEFIRLATAVIGVNRDFFAQRVAPLLKERAASVRAASLSNGAGPTPSSS